MLIPGQFVQRFGGCSDIATEMYLDGRSVLDSSMKVAKLCAMVAIGRLCERSEAIQPNVSLTLTPNDLRIPG